MFASKSKALIFQVALIVVVAFLFFACARYKSRHPSQLPWLMPDMSDHLGAEYNFIALAIFHGRGFSDPFGDQTGPTAWMPPALPYLLAFTYWLGQGSVKLAIALMVTIQVIAILLTGIIVALEARRLRMFWIGYLCFVFGCIANFASLFQITHDSAWLLILTNFLWLGSVRNWNCLPPVKGVIVWSCFGGLCALSSPVLGVVWGVCSIYRFLHVGWSCDYPRVAVGKLFLAALVFTLVITPWTIRNRMVLGKWIPIKSNGMYELWQSQVVDDDGVLDTVTLFQHPYTNRNRERISYSRQGEISFVEEKGNIAIEDLLNYPAAFGDRVANRMVAATVFYYPFTPLDAKRNQGFSMTIRRIVYALPLFSCILILWLQRTPLSPQFKAALTLCGLTLLPYVLVSYYDRYAIPLVGMKMLLVLYGCNAIRESLQSFPKNIQNSNLNQT